MDQQASAPQVSALNGQVAVPLERTLTAVFEISQLINLSLDLNTMFKLLAQKVHRLMGYDCAVILVDSDELQLTWVGYYGLSDEYIQTLNAQHTKLAMPHMSQGATGRAYRTKRPAQVNDLRETSVQLWRDAAQKEGIGSFIATPMVLKDRVMGFINCYSRRPHIFSQPEVDLLSIIGNQAAIAVEAARLLDQTRLRAEELGRLNHVLSEQNQVLNRQHTALLQTEQIHRQLTGVILDDGGLSAIVERIAGLVGRPVALCDSEAIPLAVARVDEMRTDPGGSVMDHQQLFQAPINGQTLRETLHGLEDGRSRVLNYTVSASGRQMPGCTFPVVSGNVTLGFLVVFEISEPLGELDLRAVEHGATVVALELLKQRAVMEAEQQLRGGFVDDLLSGIYEDEETIVRRAGYLGFDFDASHRVFVVTIDRESGEDGAGRPGAREIDQLRRHLLSLTVAACSIRWPAAIATLNGDRVAVVWPEDPRDRIGPAEAARILKDEINRSLRHLTVSIGIGASCRQPAEFSRSFAEARRCIEMLRAFSNTNRVLPVEELGLHRFLIRPGDEAQLLEFAHLRLDPLLEHERRYSSELVQTLNIYLGVECSLTRTAKQLTVHVNTVQYRIRRVEELTETKLRSPQGLMAIYLALFVASLRPDEFPELAGADIPSLGLPPESTTALAGHGA